MREALRLFDLSKEYADSGSERHLSTRWGTFENAMSELIGVQVGGGDPVSDTELAEFRSEVISRIDADRHAFSVCIGHALDSAVTGRWEEAFIRRSAIQLLLDDYPGSSDLLYDQNLDELKEMDEILRSSAEYADDVPDYPMLRGLPPTHWWWPFLAA
ncbi:hypothetical protein ACQPXH_00155 [Nocardia sp. CA-135953]|uniref:hypothetical protein n=1 Tax=Nocardia sp. CA-135953 TaxID=3239978 RepID=UPI003D991913